ncbi:probable sodium/metabolite cotransporter BASS5, chloroplastic, partial [Amborella trichopoda]
DLYVYIYTCVCICIFLQFLFPILFKFPSSYLPASTTLRIARFAPSICSTIRPLLAPLSVLVTACCVGSPLAINMDSILSPFGITILLPIVVFHALSFIAGYGLSGLVFRGTPDVKALQRTISYETGMQSSLLALALANRFFQDPLVSVPPAISVVIMSLMGFSLVMFWEKRRDLTAKESSLS